MKLLLAFAACALALVATAAAHHGWGSYDAANPITVEGAILTSKFENPHAEITIRDKGGKVWTVTLAPTFRMLNRGLTAEMIATSKTVSAYGYPSTVQADEMRAERVVAEGKTYEMR